VSISPIILTIVPTGPRFGSMDVISMGVANAGGMNSAINVVASNIVMKAVLIFPFFDKFLRTLLMPSFVVLKM